MILISLVIPLLLSGCGGSSKLERQIQHMGYRVERDIEGDLRVEIPVSDGESQIVGLGAHTQSLAGQHQFRNIWSVAARIPGSFPEGLAEDLLGDSWSSRNLGSWALAGRTSDGKQVLVYLIRLDANASPSLLEAALLDAARSAAELSDALSELKEE